MKYTKKEIDGLLSLNTEWTNERKQKQIKKLFKKFNARTNTSTSQKEIDNAERMMEICAEATLVYKSPAHKRNYRKFSTISKNKVKPKKKPTRKYTPKKTTSNKNDGCLIPIVISLSSFGLLIWIIIYGLL
tara:strand:- start:1598 stop:1990 length:393 start_codon:yes stop_codon:yes gene_type:complete